jgi:hypothetical protein
LINSSSPASIFFPISLILSCPLASCSSP